MRKIIYLALMGLLFGVFVTYQSAASNQDNPSQGEPMSGLKFENLLKAQLERVNGTEVIVSRVTIPPNTSLPKHWHPGEEFGYVLEGSVVLWQDGKDDIVGHKGDVSYRNYKRRGRYDSRVPCPRTGKARARPRRVTDTEFVCRVEEN
jgi:hypothetical protein